MRVPLYATVPSELELLTTGAKMVPAANQSLRIECDIMLRHSGEKMYSTYFLKGQ